MPRCDQSKLACRSLGPGTGLPMPVHAGCPDQRPLLRTSFSPSGFWQPLAGLAQTSRFKGALLALVLGWVLLLSPAPALATDLQVSEVRLDRCPVDDVGRQPDLDRPAGASCYALRGVVVNPTRRAVIDTDVFAQILDASGEPVLPNRTRVGSIGDIPPGSSEFALRLAVPAGTPGPFTVRNAKARGFSAPVRTRVGAGEERLPLEQQLALE